MSLLGHFIKGSCRSGFFLKATLWPDFTELFFRFFGLKLVIFNLTSAKNAMAFWILLLPKMVTSKLSSNAVRSTHQSSRMFFDFWLSHWEIDTKLPFWFKFPFLGHQDCQDWWDLRYGAPKRGLVQPRKIMSTSVFCQSKIAKKRIENKTNTRFQTNVCKLKFFL